MRDEYSRQYIDDHGNVTGFNTERFAAMNRCICRDAEDCKDYPHDLACLFLGRIGEHVVDTGIATRVTYGEACERVDRAAELGLVGQAVWVEKERIGGQGSQGQVPSGGLDRCA